MMNAPANQPWFLRGMEAVAMALALAAGLAVAILSILIGVDIAGRSLFGQSLQGTDELGEYTLALCGSFGLSYTLLAKRHPRIDLGLRILPSRLQDILHVVALAAICTMGLFMSWHAWGELSQTLKFGTVTNTPLQTPLWIPQSMWFLGMAFFALTGLATTLHSLFLLVHAPDDVARFYAPATIEDEVEDYIDESHKEVSA
ncbi:TRAP transporter small permease [Roseibium polysiphoniae]|uniref:TRAP transporter small permease subunit n=1 Tax=Roseibium polysiphoniae TaxID=2571221 RepID=UPI0032981762